MRAPHRGFTYIGALFLVALVGMALAGAGQLWSTASQRVRERELLWVGTQYARALRRYYENSPAIKQYPQRLEELLEDHRGPAPQRYLRRLYPDPVARSSEWGLIRGSDGRIVGVHSLSQGMPLKRGRFPPEWADFEGRESYADWQFVADRVFLAAPSRPGEATPANPATAGSPRVLSSDGLRSLEAAPPPFGR